MFASRYFAPRYFAPRYFPVAVVVPVGGIGGGYSLGGRTTKRDREMTAMLRQLPLLRKQDDEILEIIEAMIQSGLL
jgi:hypothetical protein